MTKIYAIINKETKEFQSYNGRVAWSKYGNAKNAFDANRNLLDRETFDSRHHKLYEIVELTEMYYVLKGLQK